MTTSTNDNMPPFYFPDPSVQSSIVHPSTGELWIFADGVWMIADPDDPAGPILEPDITPSPTPDVPSDNESALLRAEIQALRSDIIELRAQLTAATVNNFLILE